MLGIHDIATCVSRSEEHGKLATLMFETGQEWAAVCAFYSAYHLVRASLMTDPVFDDLERLRKISPKIFPEDRTVSKHSKGGLSSASFGVNELVSFLYPAVRARYARLHVASNQVRYERGIRAIATTNLQEDHAEIVRAFTDGELKSTLHLPS